MSGVAWSPDGSLLATSTGSRIQLWDAKTGNLRNTFTLPKLAITAPLAFSGDSKRLFSHGSNFNKTMVWDVATGDLVRMTADYRNGIRAGVLNKDGTIAVLAGSTGGGGGPNSTFMGAAHIWNITTGEMTKSISVSKAGTQNIAMNADATRAILGMSDGNAAILDLTEGKILKTIKAHNQEVRCVFMSKDGKTAITSSQDSNINVWNAETGEKIHTLSDEGVSRFSERIQASDDGKVIVTNSTLTLCVWDGTTGKLTRRQSFKMHTSGVTLSPDATKFALRTQGEGLSIFDVKSGEREKITFGSVSTPLSVSWHPKDRALVIGCVQTSPLLFQLGAEHKVQTIGNAGPCHAIGWDKEGKQIYMSGEESNVALYDVARPEKPRTFVSEQFSSTGASMSSDGRLAIASNDSFIGLWDTVKNERIRRLDVGGSFLKSVYFSPDDTKLMTLNRDELTVFDTTKWERLYSLKGYLATPKMAAWSPDGSKIASCYGSFDDGFLYLWDAKTGKRTRTIEVPAGEATAITWNPDSTLVVNGSIDGSISIWDADSRKEVVTWKAHHGEISQLAWSSNGKWIASVSTDGSARIWDAKTGKEICTIVISNKSTEWLVFTPDGQFEGTANAVKQSLYRTSGASELIPPEKHLLKQTPGLLSKLLVP